MSDWVHWDESLDDVIKKHIFLNKIINWVTVADKLVFVNSIWWNNHLVIV